jgi:hypothetical protein
VCVCAWRGDEEGRRGRGEGKVMRGVTCWQVVCEVIVACTSWMSKIEPQK